MSSKKLSRNVTSRLFNAPSASHTGGVWERQIRTVRSVLNVTLSLCVQADLMTPLLEPCSTKRWLSLIVVH